MKGTVRELLTLTENPNQPCADVDSIARVQLAEVERKIAELSALRSELKRIIQKCSGGWEIANCRIIAALGKRPG